jgi:hypothetical protein
MKPSVTSQSSPPVEATPFDDGALYDVFFERLGLGFEFYLGLRANGSRSCPGRGVRRPRDSPAVP